MASTKPLLETGEPITVTGRVKQKPTNAFSPACYAFSGGRLTTLAASVSCWHARPLGVAVVLTLAPGCPPGRLQSAHGYPGARHGWWRPGPR
jgi:hypothetical protein